MANYKKSFNFRSGVQVDDDNFIVNPNGLVGIGTSIPTEFLDVRGNAKIVGLVTASSVSTPNLLVTGVATATSLVVGRVTINSGVVTTSTGIVTYYGDGSKLLNLPTSQWVTISTPFGLASIYNSSGAVGILTTYPNHYVQIGNDPLTNSGVGFNSTGSINASGIITANSFYGSGANISSINASNIASGTLGNSRLPSNINVSGIITASTRFSGDLTGNVTGNLTGNVTGNVTGNLTGTATTASSIASTSNVQVNSINSGFSTSGISTIHTRLNVIGNIGVGTLSPTAKVEISELTGSIGQLVLKTPGNVGVANSSVFLRLNDVNGNAGYYGFGGNVNSLDIWNYKAGTIRLGTNDQERVTVTSSGNVGVGSTLPSSKLSITGDVRITGIITSTSLFISGSSTIGGDSTFSRKVGVSTSNPLYTFQVGANPTDSAGVGISSDGSVRASGELRGASIYASSGNVYAERGFNSPNGGASVSGVVTAINGFTSGNNFPVQITVDQFTNEITFNVVGIGSTTLTLY